MNVELVVFDMAGTTVADKGNVNKAFRDSFLAESILVNASDVNQVMGYSKMEAIEIILKQYAPEFAEDRILIERIHEKFNRDMVSFYENDPELKPLPFAEDLFQMLSHEGIKVALNTGFTRQITNTILKRLTWDMNPFINQVICSNEVPEGRPHPFMIQSIMEQSGISDAERVIKVGDTEVDILEGRNAGCGMVVAVTTGAYTQHQLSIYEPDFIIDSLQELPELIQNSDSRFI